MQSKVSEQDNIVPSLMEFIFHWEKRDSNKNTKENKVINNEYADY